MRIPAVLILVSLILASISFLNALPAAAAVSQAWLVRYDGPGTASDVGNAITTDTSGNVYVGGGAGMATGGIDFVTIKYNATGVQQWLRTYNGPGSGVDSVEAIAVDINGNVFVTGVSNDGTGVDTGKDIATVKYDAAGNQQWVMRYDGPVGDWDEGVAITVDVAGYAYVSGRSNHSGIWFDFDYVTIKYAPDGTQEWARRYNGPGNDWDEPFGIAVDGDGNVYVTGTHAFDLGTAYHDYATLKYDAAGALQWVRTYNGQGNNWDSAQAVTVDADGNVYVTGYSVGAPGDSYDYATIKYNAAGVEEWVRTYDAPTTNSPDIGYDIAVHDDGSVRVTGVSTQDYGTLKYGADGTQLWVMRLGTGMTVIDQAYAVALDNAGNTYVTGTSNNNAVTIRYNADGTQEWLMPYNGPAFGEEGGRAIAIDPVGDVVVTGLSPGAGTGVDAVTIKYTQTATDVTPIAGATPGATMLVRNEPNPFRSSTTIRLDAPGVSAAAIDVRVLDATGREVAELAAREIAPGRFEAGWDAAKLASGTYFYRVEAAGRVETRKMVLVR